MFKDYYECRIWLENFIPQVWTRKELGLERISHLLELLGNPQNKFKSIQIAGTSGKGSTAFYIARLLQRAKETESQRDRVGLHISPHLVDIRERMQINGKLIGLNKFIKLISEIKPAVESMKDSRVGLPSYFEILVAAALLYFAQEKVDWAVVEVGLGGRLDASNVLNPTLVVITNVGLDHIGILGNKVEKIAKEKAGIIKSGVPVVTGVTGKALVIIEEAAKQKKAPLIKVDTQSYKKALKSEVFSNNKLPIDILRSTPYSFASTNKLLAFAAVKTLGINPSKKQIVNAFNSSFSGRFEEIEENVILDGAHNADKVRFLIRWIKEKTTDYRLQTTAETVDSGQ